ncbi:MAG: hypothetical protein H7A49_00450 [Akkermansiaceae bacterium]|nr:hypothetical protein [Akkermansiaceae bacterium]MCP5542351.1 hypothetical protein [Akkermansiaceae bacterium]MCP5546114.1 hypothetical protein [Akkermansiaceae bacterium]
MNVLSLSAKRLLLLAAALFFVAGAASARAGGADGFYKPTSLEGSVKFLGRTYELPIKELRRALLDKGMLAIYRNRIPVKKVKWEDLVEEFNFRDIGGKATASGPSNIVLKKRRKNFAGRSKTPLIVRQKGKYKFVSVTLTMRTTFPTKIKDGKLTMVAPVEIRALGLTAKGSIVLEAEKQELPPIPPDLDIPGAP